MNKVILIFLSIFLFSVPQKAKANQMKEFLIVCAYGTAAGALLGLASLAFTEDPGGKINNVARGASLGLYAGIGLGLVKVYGNNQDYEVKNIIYLTPKLAANKKLEGAILNYQIFQF